MLDGNSQISKKEHRFFFALTFFGLMIRFIEFAAGFAFPARQSDVKVSFGIYSIFDVWELMSPLICIAAFVVCLSLAWRVGLARFLFSLFALVLLTYFYDYWFVDSQLRIREAALVNPDYPFKTFDFVLLGGSGYDVLSFLIGNLLFVWQITIVYRLVPQYK